MKPSFEARRQTFLHLKERSDDGNYLDKLNSNQSIVEIPESPHLLHINPKIVRMAPRSVCAACRQVLRLQFRQFGSKPDIYRARNTSASLYNTSRLFSTSSLFSVSQPTPNPYQPKPPPTNPGAAATPGTREDPSGVSSEGKQNSSSSTAPPSHSIAKELRKRLPAVTETYVAYGVCEKLVKECARQADYTIPQAREKNVQVPKTKDGEDLGVGTGWWFESEPDPIYFAAAHGYNY